MPVSEEDVTDSKLNLLKEQLGRLNPAHFIISKNSQECLNKETSRQSMKFEQNKQKFIHDETRNKLPSEITGVVDNKDSYEKNQITDSREGHTKEKTFKDKDQKKNEIEKFMRKIMKLEPHVVKCCLNSLKKSWDLAESNGICHRSDQNLSSNSDKSTVCRMSKEISCNVNDNTAYAETSDAEDENEVTLVKKLFAAQSEAVVDKHVFVVELQEKEEEDLLKHVTDMIETEKDKANNEKEEVKREKTGVVQEKQEFEELEKDCTKTEGYSECLGELLMSSLPTESLENSFSVPIFPSIYYFSTEVPFNEGIYVSTPCLSLDSSMWYGENRLSLEFLKPRNWCYRGNIYASRQTNMSAFSIVDSVMFYQADTSSGVTEMILTSAESKVCNLTKFSDRDFNVLEDSLSRKCESKRILGNEGWFCGQFKDLYSMCSCCGIMQEDSEAVHRYLRNPECWLSCKKTEEAGIWNSENVKDHRQSEKSGKDVDDSFGEVGYLEETDDAKDKNDWTVDDSLRAVKNPESFYVSISDEEDEMEYVKEIICHYELYHTLEKDTDDGCGEMRDTYSSYDSGSEAVKDGEYWSDMLQEEESDDNFDENKTSSNRTDCTAMLEEEADDSENVEDRYSYTDLQEGEVEVGFEEIKVVESSNYNTDMQEEVKKNEKPEVPEYKLNEGRERHTRHLDDEKWLMGPDGNRDRKSDPTKLGMRQNSERNFKENWQKMKWLVEHNKRSFACAPERRQNKRKRDVARKKFNKNQERKEKTRYHTHKTGVLQSKIKRNLTKGKQMKQAKFNKQKFEDRRGSRGFQSSQKDRIPLRGIKSIKGYFLSLGRDVPIRLCSIIARVHSRSGGEGSQGRGGGYERSDKGASSGGAQGNGNASSGSGSGSGSQGGNGAGGNAGGDDNDKNRNSRNNLNDINKSVSKDSKSKNCFKSVGNISTASESTPNIGQHGCVSVQSQRHEHQTSPPSLPAPRLDPEHVAKRHTTELARPWLQHNVLSPPELPMVAANIQEFQFSDVSADNFNDGVVTPSIRHATVSIDQLCSIIGDATRGLPSDLSIFRNVNQCLTHLIHNLNTASNEDDKEVSFDSCSCCLILSQLLIHMADPEHDGIARSCEQCVQMFNLIMQHCIGCIETDRQKARFTQSDLCYKICKFSRWTVDRLSLNSHRLKSKVQKYCDKVLGSTSEPLSLSYLVGDMPVGMGEMEHAVLSDTPSASLSYPSSKHSTSLSIGGNIVTTETGEPEQPPSDEMNQPPMVSVPSSAHPAVTSSAGVVLTSTTPVSSGGELPPHQKLSRKPSQRKTLAIPPSIEEENQPEQGRRDDIDILIHQRYGMRGDDPYETVKTYGERNQYGSLPLGIVHDVAQFFSVSTHPTGVPGVGEVVFGHPSQLKIVASFWDKKREECERTQTCPYQHREEGVILASYKPNFGILHTRYQKHHQWERVSHLGNGMSGKCHLAIDLKTNFKFCCKKIHLLKYTEEELSLWTEMHNRYIVRLYGAIRHGVKIYIFSEFFDGGSLAACIEEQKRLGRRLSHWSAINYFQQLLKVLAFLQKKNILHEDIKADNILLRRNSTSLAVTDFGTSRRLQDPKELKNKSPVGSPTHWSPEKASMEGHGFPSDLWAAVCVLVHMLSGEPPWVKRFLQRAGMLNYIIYARSPPMEDVPDNVQLIVRNLIEKGFVKDPQARPCASDLLQHPAFSILDEGTPETYFSTLASVAQSGLHAVRVAAGGTEQQDQRREAPVSSTADAASAESTVLYEKEISTGPYQESDSRPDLRNLQAERLPQTVRYKEQAVGGEQGNRVNEATENNLKGNEGGAVYDRDQNSSAGAVADNSQTHERDPSLTEDMEINRRVNQLLAVDINKLLPQFDELFVSGDSINTQSIKSFFIDSYSTEVLNGTKKSALQVYRPEEKNEDLPNLSIFNASWGVTSGIREEHESGKPFTVSQSGTVISSSAQADASVAGVKPPLRKKFLGTASPSQSPVQFQLSSESDDCTSADLFDPGPGGRSSQASQSFGSDADTQVEDEDFVTARETPSSLSYLQGDVSPTASTGSTLSSSGTSNLQQRKPTNLKLDVSCVPAPAKLLHSQSEIKASSVSSASGNELEYKQRSQTWSQMSSSSHTSHHDGSTPSSSHASSTFRKANSASVPSTASSSRSQFSYRPNSVREEQDKMFEELTVDMMEALSSSGSDGLTSYMDYNREDHINDETSEQVESTDYQTLLHEAIDESKLVGQKNLRFLNERGDHLFTMRIEEFPTYWKRLIPRVRQKIAKLGYKHFCIHNVDNTPIDSHHTLDTREFMVIHKDDQGPQCWCSECEMML